MFIIVGREIHLKNSTPSEKAPSFLDPTQNPFSVFHAIAGNTNPAFGFNPMVHNHQMGGIIKNANIDRTIPNPVEPKDSWKEIVKDKNPQQSGYTEQHGSSSV